MRGYLLSGFGEKKKSLLIPSLLSTLRLPAVRLYVCVSGFKEDVAYCLRCHFSESEIRLGPSARICVYLLVSLCRSPTTSSKLATNKLALPHGEGEKIIYFIDFLLYHQGLPSSPQTLASLLA